MMTMLLGTAALWARPGYNKPVDVVQPDGTTVTLLMHGDEFLSYMTTTDGYTVVKGANGFYCYAEKQGGTLKATAMVAKNAAERSAEEQAFLVGKQKGIHADLTAAAKQFKAQAAQLYAHNYEQPSNGKRRITTIWPRINYDNFKGLVILVNWNDKSFKTDNPQELYQKLTSEKNYQDDSKTYYPVSVTGSARDYFSDNSMGIFDPQFDVVGPVNIDYSCTYPHPKDADGNVDSGFDRRFFKIIKAVLDAVNSTVNFADYDLNSDGNIDMIYFIFAGYGSYVQGNSSDYLWPHANDFTGIPSSYTGIPSYDGKKFGRYACSVEIQDYEAYAAQHQWLDGIGTICHEFSHVLGLADHYDVNYEENGQAPTAGSWDVMDGGADHNYGLTPAGYNAFERHMLGFGEPTVLDVAGTYQLEAFNTSNQSFIVKTAKNNEEFYLENRQKTKWDSHLPGHGLLVWRADTSKPSIWKSNSVNISPTAMYFELYGNKAVSSFDLNGTIYPDWGTKKAAIDLYSITETDGVVTFEAGKDLYPNIVEDFENSPMTDADATDVEGKFCKWSLANAKIVQAGTYGNGTHVVEINRNGTLTSSALPYGLRTLQFTIQNGSTKIRFTPRVSTDGTTWTNLAAAKDITKNKSQEYSFQNIPAGSMIQFFVQSSSSSVSAYIDDIQISLPKDATGIDEARMAKNATSGNTYNLAGQRVNNGYKGLVIKNGKKHMNK